MFDDRVLRDLGVPPSPSADDGGQRQPGRAGTTAACRSHERLSGLPSARAMAACASTSRARSQCQYRGGDETDARVEAAGRGPECWAVA